MRPGSRVRVVVALCLLTACRRGPFPGDATLDESGYTPLMAAAMKQDVAAARRAVASGSDLERTWQGRTPLQWAIGGDRDLVEVLLDSGADIHARSGYGECPLQLAVQRGDVATVQLLLARGARPDLRERTLLHDASRRGSAELIRLVLSFGVPVDGRSDLPWQIDGTGWTALHVASAAGNVEASRALLDAGATIDAHTTAGWTALHLAAGSGHVNVVELLLDRGADARAIDTRGRTAVHLAAELDGGAVLRTMRERLPSATWKALASAADRFGRTPLHLAAWIAGRDAVDVLLADSDRNARTKFLRWTPAHLAALANDESLVGTLTFDDESAPSDVLGRVPADLLLRALERDVAATSVPKVTPVTPAWPVISWHHEDGYVSDPHHGQRIAVWDDGVVVRERDATTHEYALGVVSHERVVLLLDELRETGLLDRDLVDYRVCDGGSEELRVRDGGKLHECAVWGGFVRRVQGGLTENLAGAECERAFAILDRLRADAEVPLAARLVAGQFRKLTPGGRQPSWAQLSIDAR